MKDITMKLHNQENVEQSNLQQGGPKKSDGQEAYEVELSRIFDTREYIDLFI